MGEIEEAYRGYSIFWGDTHTNVHGEDMYYPPLTMERLRRIINAAREHLDFFAIAYYPFIWYSINGLIIESYKHRKRFDEEWKLVQKAIKEANEPGKFVTFLGYEWHSRKYGDHNVYYLRDDGPLDFSETLEELYENLRRNDGIAIPHHTGYQVGERGKNWDFHDEELSPMAEIYSSHGSSESIDAPIPLYSNLSMGPGTSGGMLQDGLNRGRKFGIIASGDNHNDFPGVWGNGLAAVFAKELTRKALWEAMKKRRVYGVTGDRIKLYFSINGHIMGEAFESDKPINIGIEVTGSDAIDRVQIIRDGRVIYTYSHAEKWAIPKGEEVVRAKIRVQAGWGPASRYGLKNLKSREMRGTFSVSSGEIVSVEPCFTYFGQKIELLNPQKCCFKFTVQPRRRSLASVIAQHHRVGVQGAVFEVEMPLKGMISIRVDGKTIDFTLSEALEEERIIAFREEAEKLIFEQFGLKPDNIENHDTFWHNAWKLKISRAIPFEGYHASISYLDESVQKGGHYYYVRAMQSNGQMAWSSPIWVKVKN
ncbi:DUF3604 domain-containing protein [Candidatus Bathyarchaeota archaeon]|nr:DUF3604 domain-containing protein [Candidatus Bathyarchaeota archaeon]